MSTLQRYCVAANCDDARLSLSVVNDIEVLARASVE
jgi:hypothetical protein